MEEDKYKEVFISEIRERYFDHYSPIIYRYNNIISKYCSQLIIMDYEELQDYIVELNKNKEKFYLISPKSNYYSFYYILLENQYEIILNTDDFTKNFKRFLKWLIIKNKLK